MRWLSLIVLVGCSFNTPVKGADQRAEAICSQAFLCFSAYPEGAEYDFFDLYSDSVPQCAANLGPSDPDKLSEAVDDGLVTYDRHAAKECVELIEALSCEDFFAEPLPEPCWEMIEGTLDYGERCSLDEACRSGWCRDGACSPPG